MGTYGQSASTFAQKEREDDDEDEEDKDNEDEDKKKELDKLEFEERVNKAHSKENSKYRQ
jgi:hypothetical protein